MGRISIVLLATAAFFTTVSCKEKVDCEKMKEKLMTCMMDNYKVLNPKGRPLDDPKYAGDKKKAMADYAGIIDKEFIEKCTSTGGKDERAAKINKCLSQKDCKDVHSCLKSVLN